MDLLIFLLSFTVVCPPADKAITPNWVFVIDTSDSMQGVFDLALTGIEESVKYPVDQHRFAATVFNDTYHYMPVDPKAEQPKFWHEGSKDTFDALRAWAKHKHQQGVHSRGMPALLSALHQPKKNLTIIVVSDGGFTSSSDGRGFAKLRQQVIKAQAWRVKQGYGAAVIAGIGIDNPHYTILCDCYDGDAKCDKPNAKDDYPTNIGKKMPNRLCLAFMRWLGTTYRGGYYLVKRDPKRATKDAVKKRMY